MYTYEHIHEQILQKTPFFSNDDPFYVKLIHNIHKQEVLNEPALNKKGYTDKTA